MLSAREKGAVACRLRDLRATWHIRHCERKRSNPEISPRKQPGLLPPTREGASADSKRAIARAASDGGSSLALLAMTGRAALRSRGMICPRFALAVIPRRERAQGKPGAQQAPAASHATKKRTSVVATGSPKQSGLPCAMVYGLFRALPGDRAFLPPSLANCFTNLTPASGRQDHTALPSAASALRLCAPPRPSHPAPTFVTIAKRPSFGAGRGNQC